MAVLLNVPGDAAEARCGLAQEVFYLVPELCIVHVRRRARGWRNSRRKPCANPDLIRLALEWRDRYGHRFRFTHIYAHTGGSDERSVKNHKADRLAVAGANKYGQIQGVIPVRPPYAGTPPSSPTRPPPAPHLFGSPLPSPSTD